MLHELQYRAHALLQIWATLAGVAAAILGIATAFSHTDSLGGWSANELLLIVGLHLLVGGLIGMVIRPSLKQVMDQVREGTFDYVLTKPVDSLLMALTQNMDLWRVVDVTGGMIIIGIAISGMESVSALAYVYAVVVLICGLVSLTSLWILLTTLTFRFIRVGELLDIAHATYEGGKWPVNLQVQWMRALLVLAVPVGVAVTFPAGILAGSLPAWVVPAVIAQAAFCAVAARILWNRAVSTYSGASA
jgi:ABC-2 type transport system permease protein